MLTLTFIRLHAPGDRDYGRKLIVHVANTEQRIHFKEVELQQKTSTQTIDPHRGQRGRTADGTDASTVQSHGVDIMTGSTSEAPADAPLHGRKAKGTNVNRGVGTGTGDARVSDRHVSEA